MKNIIATTILAFGMLFTTAFAADAGVEQYVNSGDLVQLDATNSIPDRGGEIIKYKWKQIKRKHTKKVHLLNRRTATPTFIAPEVEETTELIFRLKTKEAYDCKRVNKKGKKRGCKKYKSKDTVSIFVQPKDNNNTENNETNTSNVVITGNLIENNCGQFYVTDNALENGELYITEINSSFSNYNLQFITPFEHEGSFTIEATLDKLKTYYLGFRSSWCSSLSSGFQVESNQTTINIGNIYAEPAAY